MKRALSVTGLLGALAALSLLGLACVSQRGPSSADGLYWKTSTMRLVGVLPIGRVAALGLVFLALVLSPAASAKVVRELRLGDSVAVQSKLRPGLLSGAPYLIAGPEGPIEPGRSYWSVVLFRQGLPEGAKPALILRNLDTGRVETIPAGEGFSGRGALVYHDLGLRFPSRGRWTATLEDGTGESFELADGQPADVPGTSASEARAGAQAEGDSSEPAGGSSDDTSHLLLIAAAGLALTVAVVVLIRLRRTHRGAEPA